MFYFNWEGLYWDQELKLMFVTTFCLNLLKLNGDEETDIEALPASVKFHCLVLPTKNNAYSTYSVAASTAETARGLFSVTYKWNFCFWFQWLYNCTCILYFSRTNLHVFLKISTEHVASIRISTGVHQYTSIILSCILWLLSMQILHSLATFQIGTMLLAKNLVRL